MKSLFLCLFTSTMGISTIAFSAVSSSATATTGSEASFEVMCRNKAKEAAAEIYKDCVTEQRQTQIQKIRDEYTKKLSELKSHYDKELKKIGNSKSSSLTSNTTRPSGARGLPKKKVRTEVIDFTPATTQNSNPSSPQTKMGLQPSGPTTNTTVGTNAGSIENTANPEDLEIVELPSQE